MAIKKNFTFSFLPRRRPENLVENFGRVSFQIESVIFPFLHDVILNTLNLDEVRGLLYYTGQICNHCGHLMLQIS